MKKSLFILFFCTLFSIGNVWAESKLSPIDYLNAMTKAHRQLNYEQYYLFQESDEIESWRYRHAKKESQEYAQLLGLDGSREEFLLQGNLVGYFGNFQPFSLQTDKILDNLPAVIYADFNQLEGYSFLDMGKERIANKVARIIRIVPNDDFRYQYRLWIDEESKLLLKSELVDRDRQTLEQFRVLLNVVDENLQDLAQPIQSLILPPMLPATARVSAEQLSWKPKWIPKGFKLQSVGQEQLPTGEVVDSQLYSDGLFSFTLYLAKNKGMVLNDRFWRDGKTSVYTQTIGDYDVIIIGDIPLISARHIVQDISLNIEAE